MFLMEVRYDESGALPTVEGDIHEVPLPTGAGFLDGWVSKRITAVADLDDSDMVGVYNFIFVDRRTGDVEITNDLLGQRPLYFSISDGVAILGTIFWRVAELAAKSPSDLSLDAVAQMRSYRRLAPSSRTLLKGVHVLPAGAKLQIFDRANNFKFLRVKSLAQAPDESISADVAASQLNAAIVQTFDVIRNKFGSSELWFGNSGGLDSRLIPAYAAHSGTAVKGFIVSESKPFGFASQSDVSSDLIARSFGFENNKINYDAGNSWKRMLRDIFANPFGPANFHKNAGYEQFLGATILNGGNSFLIANDSNSWRLLSDREDALERYAARVLFRDNVVDSSVPDYLDHVRNEIFSVIPKLDNISVFRSLHQIYLNKTSPAGAFESMNLAGDFQYIYYPFISAASKEWPEAIFYDRAVQMALFKNYFPDLLKFPDQKGKVWNERHRIGAVAKVRNKVRMRFRTDGLSYARWLSSVWYKSLNDAAERFVHHSGNSLAINILRDSEACTSSQDRFDLLKLSVLCCCISSGEFLTSCE